MAAKNKKTAKKTAKKKTSPKLKQVAERQNYILERLKFEALKSVKQESRQDSVLLAAGVAHEFNNILGALEGHATWALESKKSEDQIEALKMVQLACHRAFQITRSLQYFAQPREEGVKVFSVQKISKELQDFTRPWKQFKSEWDLSKSTLTGHQTQIVEIFLNLFKNSWEAGRDHGDVLVKVKGLQLEGRYVFEIQDNGPGVAETLREQIFRPFFTTKGVLAHAHNQNSDTKSGSGLGLFLCRRIAEEHGGTLTLRPSLKGALFQLSLPLQ